MSAAHKSECPAATGHSANENTAILSTAQKTGKTEATLIAALALRGFAVHRLEVGGYLVAKWNLSRHCADLTELESFAQKVGRNDRNVFGKVLRHGLRWMRPDV